MTTSPIAWPYVPRDPSGDWGVELPGNASIGELLLWAKPVSGDPWETPIAPAGTVVSVATTYVVTGSWIDSGGASFVFPIGGSCVFKQLFRATPTPPTTIADWQVNPYHVDGHVDGTYTDFSFSSNDNPFDFVHAWAWYGPGAATPDGLTLPADTCALYVTLANAGGTPISYRIGTPLAHQGFATYLIAPISGGTPYQWWTATSLTLRNQQRIDDVSTHSTPLLPDQLP